jgi:hypothetical protein
MEALHFWMSNRNPGKVGAVDTFGVHYENALKAWRTAPPSERATYLSQYANYKIVKSTPDGAAVTPEGFISGVMGGISNLQEAQELDPTGALQQLRNRGLEVTARQFAEMDNAAITGVAGADLAMQIQGIKESKMDQAGQELAIKRLMEQRQDLILTQGAAAFIGDVQGTYEMPMNIAGNRVQVANPPIVTGALKNLSILGKVTDADGLEVPEQIANKIVSVVNGVNMESGDMLGSTLAKMDGVLAEIPELTKNPERRARLLRDYMMDSLFGQALDLYPNSQKDILLARKTLAQQGGDPIAYAPVLASPLPASFIEGLAGKKEIPLIDISTLAGMQEYVTLHAAEMKRKATAAARHKDLSLLPNTFLSVP